jgi:hypothetical protein
MIKVDLISLGDFEELNVVAHINGNDIECMMNFKISELRDSAKAEILAILKEHIAICPTCDLLAKLPKEGA